MNKGFTLIELLVVVLIIGILAGVALPQYEKSVMKSRMAAAVPIAKSIKDNMTMFHLSNGRYPTSSEFPDMVDFGEKNCSNDKCRIGDYLICYSNASPLVGVIYSPGNGLATTTQTERIGAGIVTGSSTNNTPMLACVAGGTKAKQICKSSYKDARHSWAGSIVGDVSFYTM